MHLLVGKFADDLSLAGRVHAVVNPIASTDLEEVATEWVRGVASRHDMLRAGASFLARRLERDPEELHHELLRRSEHALAQFLRAHAPAWSDEPETLAFRWCVLVRSREELRQPLQLIRGCAALMAPASPPDLVLASPDPDRSWFTEATETGAAIADAVPGLQVLIAAPEPLVEGFLQENPGRAWARVREGLIPA